MWYLATRTAANLEINRNVGLFSKGFRCLLRTRESGPKHGTSFGKNVLTAFGYEHGFLASRAFAGRDGQPMSMTIKMRMPICSSAVCRQLRSNVSLRIQRSALSPGSRLQQIRCNSSGKFLSCDYSSDPAPVILQSVFYTPLVCGFLPENAMCRIWGATGIIFNSSYHVFCHKAELAEVCSSAASKYIQEHSRKRSR
jgi:hypothetical protein